jgi:hypothetical protein
MRTKLHPLTYSLLAAFLCSCAATKITKTWKSPDCHQPVGKVAVVTVDDRGLLRQGFENRFVSQLKKGGASAMVTYSQMSLAEMKQDRKVATDCLLTNGAEAVLIFCPVGVGSTYHETQPGADRYTGEITGVESYGWYDYYSIGFMNLSPTYGNLKQSLFLEASLYDLKSGKRLWIASSKTVVKETTDRVGEMDPIVEKIVAAMRKDGVVR